VNALAFAAVLLLSFTSCCIIRFRLGRDASSRARLIATLGLLFPVIYAFLGFTLFCMSVQE
jgi:hypothetical protein